MIRELLLKALPIILPHAATWARYQNLLCWENGRRLSEVEKKVAASVGVKHPEMISLLMVDEIPAPKGILGIAARLAGMNFAAMWAITFSYGIIMRQGFPNHEEVFAHECRHVFQYENLGLDSFLKEYLTEILTYGYEDAPLEIDARLRNFANG